MKPLESTVPLIIIIVLGLLYLLQSCGGVNYDSYVTDYSDIAIEEMRRTNYPASVKLAQAILESHGGRSNLAIEHNNHFGILCGKNWVGKKHYEEEKDFETGRIVRTCYRVYATPDDSFIAHTQLMREEFPSLFRLNPRNYEKWAEGLARMRYSNNDDYDITLINMINRYNLHEYDNEAMGYAKASDRYTPKTRTRSDYDEDDYRGYTSKTRTNPSYEEEDYRSYTSRQRKQVTEYEEGLRELERDISDHYIQYPKSRYKENTYRNPNESFVDEEGYDYYQDGRRKERYKDSNYDYEDNYVQKEQWDEDSPSAYNRQIDDYGQSSNHRTRSRYSRSSIDDKYEGFSKENSFRNKPTYAPSPPKRDYRQSSKRNDFATDSYIDLNDQESTSINDFREPEDYAYINGVKVTTARYDDTPLTIAKRYNISVKDIIEYNEQINTTKQLLQEDMRVYLQEKKKNYSGEKAYHIVQFGERMHDIADAYGLSLKSLYEKNKMPIGSEPALGENIKLDRGKIRKRPQLRHISSNPTPTKSYRKQQPIADNFPNTTSNESPQETAVATVLLQPVVNQNMFHTVQKGETLYSIASRYGTTVSNIKNMNNLSTNTIKEGLSLKVR